MGSVVGEDGVDLVGDGGDQAAQEVPRGATRHLLMQFDEGELRGSVDGDEEVELALASACSNIARAASLFSFVRCS